MTLTELHCCLGHISPAAAACLVKEGKIHGIKLLQPTKSDFCQTCAEAKLKCMPFPKECQNHATKVGEVIHSDMWGPAQTQAIGGKQYWITFIDEYTCWGEVYFMKAKSEALLKYKTFEAWFEKQHSIQIKRLQSDRGGEYLSNKFNEYLDSRGIVRKLTVHDTPWQNGIAECCNGILADRVRAMLLDSGLPKFLWSEATAHTMWIQN
jgi:transposase InsO family protein